MLYSPLIICDLLVIPPSLFFEFRSQSTLDQHNDEIGSRRISSQIYLSTWTKERTLVLPIYISVQYTVYGIGIVVDVECWFRVVNTDQP